PHPVIQADRLALVPPRQAAAPGRLEEDEGPEPQVRPPHSRRRVGGRPRTAVGPADRRADETDG
ncbi:MAG: hypothetical protein ACK559_31795, partial [bacterium]